MDDILYETIAELLGLLLSGAILLWRSILNWADNILFPWFQKNIPKAAPYVRDAFLWFDKNAAVPILKRIKHAWELLRTWLLKQVSIFERKYSSNKWVRKIVSWILKEDRKVIKTTWDEEVDWVEMPDDVREQWLRNSKSSAELDITDSRDKEISTIKV